MKKNLAILGSTGKIGVQSLAMATRHPDLFSVEVLSASDNKDLILEQAKNVQPNAIVVDNEALYHTLKAELSQTDSKIFLGEEALCDVLSWDSIDQVVVATTGFQKGIQPTIAALKAKKTVAIANKETLAAAGMLIRKTALEQDAVLLPGNRALSSIFQSLLGENHQNIEKVTLTASGGAFLDKKPNFLVNVKKEHALQIPDEVPVKDEKAGIDSSSLMSKGLELMAAKWLFDLKDEQLDIIIHPQSIIQSMVQFKDGAIKTQVGKPGSRFALSFALSFPDRIDNPTEDFPFNHYEKLTFQKPDEETFRQLPLAKEAMKTGQNMPCILNAANEVVVQAFLDNRIGFTEMSEMIEKAMQKISLIKHPSLADLQQTDEQTREFVYSLTENSQLYH